MQESLRDRDELLKVHAVAMVALEKECAKLQEKLEAVTKDLQREADVVRTLEDDKLVLAGKIGSLNAEVRTVEPPA